MAEKQRIAPDIAFVREIRAFGGDAVTACYQCAGCSVACPLAPAESPFPRKEMLWAQWGLKDRLTADCDIWLCHECRSCSESCPRGARPGDVLAAARTVVYRDLVGPRFLGVWLHSPRYLPLLVAIPAALFGIIWLATAGLGLPRGEIVFGKLFPGDTVIDPLFVLLALGVLWTFFRGVTTLWRRFRESTPTTLVIGEQPVKPTLLESIQAVVAVEIASHAKWLACGDGNTERFSGHRALFYGFVTLAFVTAVLAVGHWGGRAMPLLAPLGLTPMPLWSPVKILANAGALAFVYGLARLTRNRLRVDPATAVSSYNDWYLLGVLWAVAVTGLGAEGFRLADAAGPAYVTYYLHLIAVFLLLGSLPFSKLGHGVYRTTALIFAHQAGRAAFPRREETVLRL